MPLDVLFVCLSHAITHFPNNLNSNEKFITTATTTSLMKKIKIQKQNNTKTKKVATAVFTMAI